jgi:hypothetical protein
VRAAAITGRYTYEGLAEFAGGRKAKVVAEKAEKGWAGSKHRDAALREADFC